MKNLLFILTFLTAAFSSHAQNNYYFSADGNDNNAGSSTAPFKNINKLNTLALKPGDHVFFHRGDSFSGQANISASGTQSSPIVFDSYGQGNKPIINGSAEIRNWKQQPGSNIWQASYSSRVPITDLYINSVAAPLARYPRADGSNNRGHFVVASHDGKTQLTSRDGIKGNWVGAELVYRPNQWSVDKVKITGQNGNTFTTTAGVYEIADGWGFFLQNDIRGLNSDGDWCYDAQKNVVSIYYAKGNPNNQKIEVTSSWFGINFTNTSNILLQNLEIDKTSNCAINGTNLSNFTIKNVDIDNSGLDGIEIKGDKCDNILIENCLINHANNDGVYVNYATNFKFINNTIKNIGLKPGRGKSGSGNYTGLEFKSDIGKGDVGNVLIEGNKIDSTGYNGISFRASNIMIKNNSVSNFCMVKSDGGGIYTFDADKNENTKQTIANNIIIGAQVDSVPVRNTRPQIDGIYLDDCSRNIIVSNNTIANCVFSGIFVHGGTNIAVVGNTCYNNHIQYSIGASNGCDNTGVTTHLNTFVSKSREQTVAVFGGQHNPSDDYGQFSNNFYASPDIRSAIVNNGKGSRGARRLSLQEWTTQTGKDSNSTSVGGDNVYRKGIKFLYNASSEPKTEQLDGNYKDVKNQNFNGQVTIQPYSSIILYKVN